MCRLHLTNVQHNRNYFRRDNFISSVFIVELFTKIPHRIGKNLIYDEARFIFLIPLANIFFIIKWRKQKKNHVLKLINLIVFMLSKYKDATAQFFLMRCGIPNFGNCSTKNIKHRGIKVVKCKIVFVMLYVFKTVCRSFIVKKQDTSQ